MVRTVGYVARNARIARPYRNGEGAAWFGPRLVWKATIGVTPASWAFATRAPNSSRRSRAGAPPPGGASATWEAPTARPSRPPRPGQFGPTKVLESEAAIPMGGAAEAAGTAPASSA